MNKVGPEFWERVAGARKKIIGLDYDGTLAPFRVQRDLAQPLPGVMDTLVSIIDEGSTIVAIVSGRSMTELIELIGPAAGKMILVGLHGRETRAPNGETYSETIDRETMSQLDSIYHKAILLGTHLDVEDDIPDLVEKKMASVAVHTRGIPADVAREWIEGVENVWQSMANEQIERLEFKGGVEFRVKGKNKGDAFRDILKEFESCDLVVYIGDDTTDEDAFRVLPANGIGVRVGQCADTAAEYGIEDCGGVLEFLRRWNDTVRAVERRVGDEN